MDVPYRYPYNPPVLSILALFGYGFLWMAGDWLERGHPPTGFSLWFSLLGVIPIGWALIIGVRRILVDRYLVVDNDSMVLPIGPLQMGTAKIEYASIRRVWRHYIRPYEYRFVLKVATEEQAFKILPSFLPDNESYRALEEFLNRKLLENTSGKKSRRD